ERSGEGVQGGLDRGTTFTETVVQSSEQSVFILAPTVATISPGSGTSATILTVTGKRLFQSELKSYVYVRDVGIEVGFKPGDPFLPPTPTQVQVPLTALTKTVPPLSGGTYPVRIQVNGALNLKEQSFIYS